jgi:amino acid permease
MRTKSDDPSKLDIENNVLNQTTALNVFKVEMYETGIQFVEQAGTKRNIKSSHGRMIAIGSAIGIGLFLGIGQALSIGDPGFCSPTALRLSSSIV